MNDGRLNALRSPLIGDFGQYSPPTMQKFAMHIGSFLESGNVLLRTTTLPDSGVRSSLSRKLASARHDDGASILNAVGAIASPHQ